MESIEVEDLNTRIVLEAAAANNLAAAENAEAKAKLALLEIEGGGADLETFRPLFETQSLEDLVIPEGITKIANYAFMGRGVRRLTISSTVESLGDYAFSVIPIGVVVGPLYTILNAVTFVEPSSLKTIGTSVFASQGIARITLPEGVESIGMYALADIFFVTIPSSVKTLENLALLNAVEVTFIDKTCEEVSALENYPWGIDSFMGKIHCSDGDITFQG